MTKSEPGWELYRSFLAVTQTHSLSAAARRLSLTQPTLGRHIDALEQALGVALFTRSQLGLTATPAALDLIPHAEAMAAAAEALSRAASGQATEERGTVRVTASEIVGAEILPAILTRFRERHPGVVIELALTNRTEDLLRRDADIAVRMMRPTQDALVARRIGKVAIGLFAHRGYVRIHGLPKDLEDLAEHAPSRHAMIGFDRDASSARVVGGLANRLHRDMFAFRSDSDLAQLAALRAGIGIAGCQIGIAVRDPDLVPVLPEIIRFELEMWLAMHEDLRNSRRVRLLFDHMFGELSDHITDGSPASRRNGKSTRR
jgi:DNA-binding transcriptional LysR family regulator